MLRGNRRSLQEKALSHAAVLHQIVPVGNNVVIYKYSYMVCGIY